MNLEVKISNLGKLTDATIRIGQFTVFAGPNNTGKSFVSKAMYSLLRGAMKANHLKVALEPSLETLHGTLGVLDDVVDGSLFTAMFQLVSKLHKDINKIDPSHFAKELDLIEKVLPDMRRSLAEIQDAFSQLKKKYEGKKTDNEFKFPNFLHSEIKGMEPWMHDLAEVMKWDAKEIVRTSISRQTRQNFIQNFQVTDLKSLRNENLDTIDFEITDIGSVGIKGETIHWNIPSIGIYQLQKFSKILYLESPVFWKPKKALEVARREIRDRIGGIPKYIYDVFDALEFANPTDENTIDRSVSDKLTSSVGGRITISEAGDWFFDEEGGGTYPLQLAAMGIANLGMLALLIERNLLDEDTWLFIDEPEAHLHPEWQVVMAEVLFALAEKGVHIVIATHSPDILKWLEVHIEENPAAEELVALNHFSKEGVQASDGDFMERLNAVQRELSHSFYKLYYQGL